jgi:cytochrome c-type biogenesis protein CcmH
MIATVKRWPGWMALGVLCAAMLVIGAVRASAELTEDQRVNGISKRLACPICDGESVFESRNGASDDIRNQIRSQVRAGRTDAEVIAYVQSRSPEADLTLVPDGDGIELWVWVLPVVAVTLAGVGLGVAFARWRRQLTAEPSADDEALVSAAVKAQAAGER